MSRVQRLSPESIPVSRREWLQYASVGAAALSTSGWMSALAQDAAANPARKRACILLWMSGGPSQIDTFDLKPGTPNGGPFKPIDTSAAGLQIGEHLPQLAQHGQRLAVIRSMTTKEGDHTRATQYVRNGYLPQGPIRYPTLGSLIAKELGNDGAELPNFVSIAPYRVFAPNAYTAGYLGSAYDPLLVGDGSLAAANAAANGDAPADDYDLKVADLAPPPAVGTDKVSSRLKLLGSLNDKFVGAYGGSQAIGHRIAYERAIRLMQSAAGKAFDLSEEPAEVRDRYGRNRFGQGCLLARRLIERGVPFVEVTHSGVGNGQALGWDTHADNFESLKSLCGALDPAWATLLTELEQRGLLDTTMVVWAGEFGRTPKINDNTGRDHFPDAWSAVLAGGGVRGGQAIGATSADGQEVKDHPVSVPDFLATVCKGLGVDPLKQNMSNVGRPIRVVDPVAKPVVEALA